MLKKERAGDLSRIYLAVLTVLSLAAAVSAKDPLIEAAEKARQFKMERRPPELDAPMADKHAKIRYWLETLNDPQAIVETKKLSVRELGKSLQSDAFSINRDLGERVIDALTDQLDATKEDSLRIAALDILRQTVKGVRLTWRPEGGGQCLRGEPGHGTRTLKGYCDIITSIMLMARPLPSDPPPRLSPAVKIAWIQTAAALMMPGCDFFREFAEGISKFGQDPDSNVKKAACGTLEKLAKDYPREPGIRRCPKL